MALTITPMYKWSWGASEFMAVALFVGDTSYPTGGYPLTPVMFTFASGFASTSDSQLQVPPPNPVGVWADASNTGAAIGGYAAIDAVTGNLRLFLATGTEVAGAATAASFKTALIAFGH